MPRPLPRVPARILSCTAVLPAWSSGRRNDRRQGAAAGGSAQLPGLAVQLPKLARSIPTFAGGPSHQVGWRAAVGVVLVDHECSCQVVTDSLAVPGADDRD